jgi:hypothetical protein
VRLAASSNGDGNGRLRMPVDTAAYIPLPDVPALPFMPRRHGHKKLDARSIRRWASRGFNGLKLRTELVGGFRCTTVDWLREFIERRSAGDVPAGKPTVNQRHRQHEQATAFLASIGV